MSNESWPSVRLIGLTLPVHDDDYSDRLPLRTVDQPLVFDPLPPPLDAGLDLIEFAGRWDYGPKSISKMANENHGLVIKRWLDSGEESMVEMVDAIFLITCSRVVSHELVRHRLASYQQESQRFVNYEDEDVDELFFTPPELAGLEGFGSDYEFGYFLELYRNLRKAGVPKQIARYVLPNATRTRIVVKMNLREWRHVLRLRLHKSAQPEMQQVMALVHAKLRRIYGEDLFPANIAEERAAR